METFADYVLAEEDFDKKVEIVWYLQKKMDIFFDHTSVFKAMVADWFVRNMNIDVDRNLVVTAALLCACKKVDIAQSLDKIRGYAKESAEFLATLGFSQRFCKICEEQNRYSGSNPRERESDVLELADQFGGMLLPRPERPAFPIEEALVLLEYRNLKGKNNIYLEQFKEFIEAAKEVFV